MNLCTLCEWENTGKVKELNEKL